MEEKIKTSIIYCRCSTDKKDENDSFEQTPELQIKPILQTFPDSIDAEIFTERGSAWKKQGRGSRPKFEELVRMIEAGQVENVYIYSLNRIARNMMRGMEFFMLCMKHDVQLYSVQQKMLSEMGSGVMAKAMQHVMVVLYNAFAELDSTDKSQKIKTTVIREKGKPTVSFKGKLWGGKSWIKEEDIKKAVHLRQGGASYRAIAKEVGCSVSRAHSLIHDNG